MVTVIKNRLDDEDRVVITGIGVVSSIGIGKDAFWDGLTSGKSGLKAISLFDTSKDSSKLAGEIIDFKPEDIVGQKGLRNLDRSSRLAICATKLALDDAKFAINETNADSTGIVLGSTMGSIWSISEFDKESIREGFKAVNPALFPNTVINSPASQISIKFGIKGFNSTVATGFAASLDAIEYAKNFLLLKKAKTVLVGGSEEFCEQIFRGFDHLRLLSGSSRGKLEICAPFDRRRNGVVLGEGAVMFVLENLDSAIKRNAHIYAKIGGYASFFDRKSFNRYNTRTGGAKIAISKAIHISNKKADEIDYVSASANSTVEGDVAEARALIDTLNNGKKEVVVSSSKSMLGETYSASGAFQIATAVLAIERGVMAPTINFVEADKRCPVDCIPNISRQGIVKNSLISNISPTGQSTALIISRFDL